MMSNNSSNSRANLTPVDDSFGDNVAATQLDPPIPSVSSLETPHEESLIASERWQRCYLSIRVKELSGDLNSLVLQEYERQDFEKYRSIFYSNQALVLMMADHKDPPSDPKKWTQQGRDSARLFALKAAGTFPRTIDTISPNSVFPGVHCQSSLNDLRHLIPNMFEAFGEDFQPVDEMLQDYHRTPDHWLVDNLSPAYFSEVIPHFLANDNLLKPRGRIFLPNTPYVYEQIKLNFQLLSQFCEDIRFIHDPTLNPLYNATETVDELLKASRTSNATALQVLLDYKHMPKGVKKAPFIVIIKRGAEDGDLVIDLMSKLYNVEQTTSFHYISLAPAGNRRNKRVPVVEFITPPPTPMKKQKTRTSSSSSSNSSGSSPIIDLTSDDQQELPRSSSGIKGRVSFTP